MCIRHKMVASQQIVTLLLILHLCYGDFIDKLLNMNNQERHIDIQKASSYLDLSLWYNTTVKKLIYDVIENRFKVQTSQVLKFKYDIDDNVQLPATRKELTKKVLNRRRREVFGKDNRIHIKNKFVNTYPFATAVRLDNGCTGTIIWKQHVLTSAHCVHDRTKLNPPLNKIRVGLLNTDGTFTWFRASKVFVPPGWTKHKALSYLNHDYAVIKLDRRHGRKWMPFGSYNLREKNIIQFTGFPSDKSSNEMWYSYCDVTKPTKHVFINHCDAAPGMSGSGVYVYNKKNEKHRKLVAVFSSYVQYKEYGRNSVDLHANIATRLTTRKVNRICKWMDAGTNCYKLSTVFSTERRRYS